MKGKRKNITNFAIDLERKRRMKEHIKEDLTCHGINIDENCHSSYRGHCQDDTPSCHSSISVGCH